MANGTVTPPSTCADTRHTSEPLHPVPICRTGPNYFLYHTPTIAHIRTQHRIAGVLIGTLPQAPQQNVFLGLPLQLMPEEVILLARQGHAYVVDDVVAHRHALGEGSVDAVGREGRVRWKAWLDGKGREGANARRVEKERDMLRALQAKEAEKKGPRKDDQDSLSTSKDQSTKDRSPSSPTKEDHTTSDPVDVAPHDDTGHQHQTNEQDADSEP